MRNTLLAITAVVFVIAMAAASVISYNYALSSVAKESPTSNGTVTQFQYVTITKNNTVVSYVQVTSPVSQTLQQSALTFSVIVHHQTNGVLTIESSDNCEVTVLPVSMTTESFTEYRFPMMTKTINGNTIEVYDFNESISSYFNATIVTLTQAVQGAITTYINGTYYEVPIIKTTESLSSNLMQTYTLTGIGTPIINSTTVYRTYVTSTCPEFTSQG